MPKTRHEFVLYMLVVEGAWVVSIILVSVSHAF
jgi:hypothetical protein